MKIMNQIQDKVLFNDESEEIVQAIEASFENDKDQSEDEMDPSVPIESEEELESTDETGNYQLFFQ
jgi:hypothetical protein